MYELHQELIVPKPIDEVFAFFDRPENLDKLTPSFLKFKILTPSPITMNTGTMIDYTVTNFGLPMRWTSVINEYDPPNHFVDIQLKGPYSFWHHRHEFVAEGDQTRVIDHITYDIGFGVFGKIAHLLFVKRQLKKIFAHRLEMVHVI